MPAAARRHDRFLPGRGIGVVFTEWASFEVKSQRYQKLAPLLLLDRNPGSGAAGKLTFYLTAQGHALWNGLPASFTTRDSADDSAASVINGGTTVAMVSNNSVPGVVVRDGAGRIVHLNHSALYTSGWQTDGPTIRMFTNALQWAAHCL
jgi:hypothetical protein